MVSGSNNFDDDIMQAKEDLLKAKNIVPPFGKPLAKPQEAQKETPQDLVPTPIAQPQPNIGDLQDQNNSDIDREELAEEFKTDSELESRILAGLEASPDALAASPDPQSQPEEEDEEEPQSWIQMIKKQAANSTPVTGTDIPKFNLAEQIMAQQRKNVSDRRKGPGHSTVPVPITAIPPAKPALAPTFKDPFMPIIRPRPSAPTDTILAGIVARDIQKFLKHA